MERLYFTWPDRRFRYECRGCGACCKGHGIGLDVDVREWFTPPVVELRSTNGRGRNGGARKSGRRPTHSVPATTVPADLIESFLSN